MLKGGTDLTAPQTYPHVSWGFSSCLLNPPFFTHSGTWGDFFRGICAEWTWKRALDSQAGWLGGWVGGGVRNGVRTRRAASQAWSVTSMCDHTHAAFNYSPPDEIKPFHNSITGPRPFLPSPASGRWPSAHIWQFVCVCGRRAWLSGEGVGLSAGKRRPGECSQCSVSEWVSEGGEEGEASVHDEFRQDLISARADTPLVNSGCLITFRPALGSTWWWLGDAPHTSTPSPTPSPTTLMGQLPVPPSFSIQAMYPSSSARWQRASPCSYAPDGGWPPRPGSHSLHIPTPSPICPFIIIKATHLFKRPVPLSNSFCLSRQPGEEPGWPIWAAWVLLQTAVNSLLSEIPQPPCSEDSLLPGPKTSKL